MTGRCGGYADKPPLHKKSHIIVRPNTTLTPDIWEAAVIHHYKIRGVGRTQVEALENCLAVLENNLPDTHTEEPEVKSNELHLKWK